MQATQQEEIARPHWVRVMGEYSSTGLWDSTGTPLEYDELPISPALRDALSAWRGLYESNEDYSPGREGSFDYVAFAAQGLALAKNLKKELPDWTVIYFDEGRARAAVAKESSSTEKLSYEFEVLPE